MPAPLARAGHAADPAPPPRRGAIKNQKFRAALVEVIKQAGAEGGCPKAQGALLYTLGSKVRGAEGGWAAGRYK